MNTQKIDCREPLNQNHGLIINDCSSEFANRSSSQLIGFRQPWQMGTCVPMEGGSQQQYNVPAKSSTTIMSRLESPASAFYATERCMGFQQYDCQAGNPSLSPQFSRTYDSQLPSYQSSGEDFSTDPEDQAGYNFDLRNTLQAIVKSQFSSNQYYGSSENSNKIQCSNSTGCKLLPHEQNKLPGDDTIYGGGHLLIPFKGNQDHMVCTFNSFLGELIQV